MKIPEGTQLGDPEISAFMNQGFISHEIIMQQLISILQTLTVLPETAGVEGVRFVLCIR